MRLQHRLLLWATSRQCPTSACPIPAESTGSPASHLAKKTRAQRLRIGTPEELIRSLVSLSINHKLPKLAITHPNLPATTVPVPQFLTSVSPPTETLVPPRLNPESGVSLSSPPSGDLCITPLVLEGAGASVSIDARAPAVGLRSPRGVALFTLSEGRGRFRRLRRKSVRGLPGNQHRVTPKSPLAEGWSLPRTRSGGEGLPGNHSPGFCKGLLRHQHNLPNRLPRLDRRMRRRRLRKRIRPAHRRSQPPRHGQLNQLPRYLRRVVVCGVEDVPASDSAGTSAGPLISQPSPRPWASHSNASKIQPASAALIRALHHPGPTLRDINIDASV